MLSQLNVSPVLCPAAVRCLVTGIVNQDSAPTSVLHGNTVLLRALRCCPYGITQMQECPVFHIIKTREHHFLEHTVKPS
jgi:hypothetical protein